MNDAVAADVSAVEEKIRGLLVRLLKLGDDVELPAEANLTDQIGLDSIEAFDAVATLHELMDVSIPDDFNPASVNSIRALGAYVTDRFGADAVARFLAIDLEAVAGMRADEEI